MRRPPVHDDAPSADRWMVSWADFTTLLFALFVVLYASSSANDVKTRQVSQALGQAFGAAPEVVPAPTPVPVKVPATAAGQEQQQVAQIAQAIREALAGLLAGGQVNVTQSARGIGIDINASLLFTPGQAHLSTGSGDVITAVASVLTRYPYRIQVEGHTDSLPIHTAQFASNWELSSARASSVVRRLIEEGIAADRLAVIGHAANQSLESNTTPEGRARNRRVHVMILAGED